MEAPDNGPTSDDEGQATVAAFEITAVDWPEEVLANTAPVRLPVTWSGDAILPFRLVFRAVEDGCPSAHAIYLSA